MVEQLLLCLSEAMASLARSYFLINWPSAGSIVTLSVSVPFYVEKDILSICRTNMNCSIFKIISDIKFCSRKRRITDNDLVDRINFSLTSTLLTILALLICTKTYLIGKPLHCWTPKEFSSAWQQYAESFCWVQNTYFVKLDQQLSKNDENREEKSIVYYQWVPFLLLVQAMSFLLPSIFWRSLNDESGKCCLISLKVESFIILKSKVLETAWQ